jgi:hypothetical protein
LFFWQEKMLSLPNNNNNTSSILIQQQQQPSSTKTIKTTTTTNHNNSNNNEELFRLRKQVEILQAKLVEVKQRAKNAIKEALRGTGALPPSSTGGTGSKPPYRARTCSLDSLESGLGPIQEDSILNLDKSTLGSNSNSELLETSTISSSSTVSTSTTTSSGTYSKPDSHHQTNSSEICPSNNTLIQLCTSGVTKERTVLVPSLSQLTSAILHIKKGDYSHFKQYRFWFTLATYLLIIHCIVMLWLVSRISGTITTTTTIRSGC